MKRWLILAAVLVFAALLFLPRPYSGSPAEPGDLPPLVTTPAKARPRAEDPLDLNTATLEQLQTLPEIGETRARAILDYRTQNGDFQSVDELAAVDGIGSALLEGLREYVTVNP